MIARQRIVDIIEDQRADRTPCTSLVLDPELVPLVETIAICRDPDDDKFVELAINGRADLIVSGDGDLRELGAVRGIPIITPAAFAQLRLG